MLSSSDTMHTNIHSPLHHPNQCYHSSDTSIIREREGRPGTEEEKQQTAQHISMWEEMKILLVRPVFVCLIFASAAQTAVLIGLSTFGSSFMMSLGLFDSETEASTMFGVLVSIAGIVATPLGGWILDRSIAQEQTENQQPNQTAPLSDAQKDQQEQNGTDVCMRISIEHTYWATYVGTVILCCIYFVHGKTLYLCCITMGCACCFFTNTGLNMAIMLSVPERYRSLGIAIGTVCGHAFGDVPSPILAGWMKDALAPDCVASESDDANDMGNDANASDVNTSAACRAEEDGIRMTMLMITLWMFWAVFLTGLAWRYQLMKTSRCS
jgi:MFS family permease